MRGLPRFAAAALALASLPVACGGEPAPAPAGGAGEPSADVAWDPQGLAESPGEMFAQPGSGTTWLSGVVVDEDDRPVAGAEVEMRADARDIVLAPPILHASTRTGPDGRFRVGPGPTPWRIEGALMVSAPGYVRACHRSRLRAEPGEDCADEGEEVRVVLRKGIPARGRVRAGDGGGPDAPVSLGIRNTRNYFEVAATDDAGGFSFLAPPGPVEILLLPGIHPATNAFLDVKEGGANYAEVQAIRGRDVRGRVVDAATGKPIPGAAIRGRYGPSRIFRVDADGGFLLPRYWSRAFEVYAPGYAMRLHQLSDDAGSSMVGLETVRLVPGLVAKGRVTDLDGRPIGPARLRSFTRDPDGTWVAITGPIAGQDGSFTFVGLPLPRDGSETRAFASCQGFAVGLSEPIRGRAGGVLEVGTVKLPRLVEVEGRLVDEEGAPADGKVTVRWEPGANLDLYRDVVPSTSILRAGSDGRWEVTVPERSLFRLEAEDDSFAPARGEATAPAHPASAPDPSRGDPPPPVVKVFRGPTIRGSVRDSAGAPVTQGEIRVEPEPAGEDRPSRDAHLRRDGTFVVGGLKEGVYGLAVVVHPEFIEEILHGVRAGGEPVDVRLRRPGSVRGRFVLPRGSAAGLPGWVTIRSLGGTRILPPQRSAALGDADGRFHVGPLEAGPYALSAVAGDWRCEVPRVEVGEGAPTDLGNVVLSPGGVVEGTVTLGGAPAEGIEVEVSRVLPDGRTESRFLARTRRDGRFHVGGLAAGTHILVARPPGSPEAELRFEAVPGETREVVLAVPRGARLLVKAVDASGAPAEGARVLLSGPKGSLAFWKEGSTDPGPHATGADGTLRCAGLPAGEVRVFAEKPGAGSGSAATIVAEDGTATVEVRLAK